MMYKVLRNSAGEVVAFGPNIPEYDPLIKNGETLTVEKEMPALSPDYAAMRAQAYRDESDPLFFKSQRGEATNQEWIDKVAEIKARWPE